MYVVRERVFVSFLLCLLTLSVSRCGDGRRSLTSLRAPSNQSVVVTSDYPAVVKVITPGGSSLCTGTFVSPRAVLTAAHCTPYTNGTYTIVASFGVFTTNNAPVNFGPGVVDDPNDLSILYFNTDVATGEGHTMKIGDSVFTGDDVRLVGFGCNDIARASGSGVKRTGTNEVYHMSDYIELVTPLSTVSGVRAILGPENRAGSCFGDSGGPLLKNIDGELQVVGVAHAGGYNSRYTFSDYVSMTRNDNRNFVYNVNQAYNLGIDI